MELSLLNLLLILVVAFVAGNIATRMGHPAVMGELLAGIILGPPLLGLLQGGAAIAVLAEVGVLLMMLYIGMEVDPADLKKVSWAGALAALGGFITPFVLAYFTVRWFGGSVMAGLFVAIAAGITSLATKSRILSDLKLLDTRVAHVMMAGALIADTLSLIIFTLILGLAESGVVNMVELGLVTLRILAFFALTIVIGLKVFPWVGHRITEAGWTGRTFNFTLVLIIAVFFGEMAELAGLHAILGAFLAGLFLRENVLGRKLSEMLTNAVEDASIGFLAPIFFVTAGFGVTFDVFSANLGLFLAIMAVATLGKILGTALFYLPTGYGWREGLAIGAGMNGRGAVEIIVAGIALDMGLISQDIFSILVFMAIFTTAAVPLFLKWGTEWLRRRGELVRREEERHGVLIIGADTLAREMGKQLARTQRVWLLDSNQSRCNRARDAGLNVICGNALQENILSVAHAAEVSTLIAMTSNAEVNMLTAQLARDVFLVPNLHILRVGGDGMGRTSTFKRLEATGLFGTSLQHASWNQWIRDGSAQATSFEVDPVETPSIRDLLPRLQKEGQCLPLVVESEDKTLPIHSETQFRSGDVVTALCHASEPPVREVAQDRFDEIVDGARILDLAQEMDIERFFEIVSGEVEDEIGVDAATLQDLLLKREETGSSLIAPGFAVPHVVVDEPGIFKMVVARAENGVLFPRANENARALFVLFRSRDARALHLRVLAAIAQIIQHSDFEELWNEAPDEQALRQILRTTERRRFEELESA